MTKTAEALFELLGRWVVAAENDAAEKLGVTDSEALAAWVHELLPRDDCYELDGYWYRSI